MKKYFKQERWQYYSNCLLMFLEGMIFVGIVTLCDAVKGVQEVSTIAMTISVITLMLVFAAGAFTLFKDPEELVMEEKKWKK